MSSFLSYGLVLLIILIEIKSSLEYECAFQYPSYIRCDTTDPTFNLKIEFDRLSYSLPVNELHYNILYLENLPITTIPSNAFAEITFDEIYVTNLANLTAVHTNAFNNTANQTLRLYFQNTYRLRNNNNSPDYDLYAAINSLTNLEEVYLSLDSTMSNEIPAQAFKNANLNTIVFGGYFVVVTDKSIVNVTSNAFGNTNAIYITLSNIIVNSIAANAFDSDVESQYTLFISFYNTSLTDAALQSNSFSGSKRPLQLNLGYNQIEYIDESVFSAFFSANPQNSLILRDNPLRCDESVYRFLWLLTNKDNYQNQTIGAFCRDGTELWDINPTTSSPTTSQSTSTIQTTTPSAAIINVNRHRLIIALTFILMCFYYMSLKLSVLISTRV